MKTPLTDELFRIMDLDGNQRIDFNEPATRAFRNTPFPNQNKNSFSYRFVAIALVYCMYTKDDILKFCFDLFDLDGSGTIDERGARKRARESESPRARALPLAETARVPETVLSAQSS